MNRFIVFDRDGTLIVEKDYLSDPDKIELFEDSISSLKKLKEAGYRFLVITNQSGIARGYYSLKDAEKVNNRLKDIFKKESIDIEKFYICPHHPKFSGECSCRKPETDLLKKACGEFDIDLKNSFFVGDKCSDVVCGQREGMKGVLILTGYGTQQKEKCNPDIICNDLSDFAEKIS